MIANRDWSFAKTKGMKRYREGKRGIEAEEKWIKRIKKHYIHEFSPYNEYDNCIIKECSCNNLHPMCSLGTLFGAWEGPTQHPLHWKTHEKGHSRPTWALSSNLREPPAFCLMSQNHKQWSPSSLETMTHCSETGRALTNIPHQWRTLKKVPLGVLRSHHVNLSAGSNLVRPD